MAINATTFPDANFRAYVSNNFDKDSNGVLSDAEIVDVTDIYVCYNGISSLQGVEYFTALTELDCQANQLTVLDVSKNTALTTLYCYNNQLTTLDVSNNTALKMLQCPKNQLTALDVSKNTALTDLNCRENKLTALDVGNNTALHELWCQENQLATLDVSKDNALSVLNCSANRLTALDVSKNTYLARLYCEENQLAVLDLSNNTNLWLLNCSSNQLTTLDLSNNARLGDLDCSSNQLTALDVSGCTNLRYLDCPSNQLETLDVGSCGDLRLLDCHENKLVKLDVSKNTALQWLTCGDNQLTTLDLSNNTKLFQLYCSHNQLAALDLSATRVSSAYYLECVSQEVSPLYITDTGNTAYPYQLNFSSYMSSDKFVNVSDVLASDDTSISTTYANGIAQFVRYPAKVTYNYTVLETSKMDVAIVPSDSTVRINAENFPDDNFRAYVSSNFDKDSDDVLSEAEIAAVTSVYVGSYSYVSSLQGIEYFTALTSLTCDSTQLTTLDVSKNTALTYLSCNQNSQLTTINASGCTALKNLYCSDNPQLTVLDISGCAALIDLECWGNRLTALDVSKSTALRRLDCDGNALTALDVSKNTALTYLTCRDNQLTELDVSKNVALTSLNCINNQLTALDVSSNTALETLHCSSNQLTALDVSKNTALTWLTCGDNQLTELDVSKNTDLQRLGCEGNQLAKLDLSNNTELWQLYCSRNQLAALDLSATSVSSAYNLKCESQEVSPLYVTGTGKTSYPYQLDLSDYMSSDKFVNVSDVQGLASDDTSISTTYANGVAQFAACPAKVTYNYTVTTRYITKEMDVTISELSLIASPEISGTFADSSLNANYSETATVNGGTSPYTWEKSSGTLPTGLGLTYSGATATLSGTPTAAGTFEFTLKVTDANNLTATKSFSVKITKPKISGTLSDSTVKATYSKTLKVSGGAAPYTWKKSSGTLPAGLKLTYSDAKATISGSPTAAGTYTFKIKVTDANKATATKSFTVNITKPAISGTLANGTVNTKYSKTLKVSGGTESYTWVKSSGTLPNGLKLKSSNTKATLSGTPTEAGTFKFKIKVTDANKATATKSFTITIAAASASGKDSSSKTDSQSEKTTEKKQSEHDETQNSLPENSPEVLEGEDTEVSLYAELKVVSEDIVEAYDEKDSDLVKVKAGVPLRFTVGEWGTEVSDVVVYVDDKPLNSVEVSRDGEFTLPAEIVQDDFKVGVKAKSTTGERESEELYIIAE